MNTTIIKLAIAFLVIMHLFPKFVHSQTCNTGDIVITSGTTVTWDPTTKTNPYIVTQNVCVEDGATLNINNLTVHFDATKKITVHKGGTLNLNNSILKPRFNGDIWGGIYVMGDHDKSLCDETNKTLNTKNHGFLSAESSTIEGSLWGLKMEGYGYDFFGGGIIKVNNCTFLNNKNAAIFFGILEVISSNCLVNSVTNSTFIKNDDIYAPTAPHAFIEMSGHRGLTVLGCKFEVSPSNKFSTIGIWVREGVNQLTGTRTWGAGKLFVEASEYVNPHNYQNSPKFVTPRRTEFINLKIGILMEGHPTFITPFESIIKNCNFNKVQSGMQIYNAQNVTVACNNYNADIYDVNYTTDLLMRYTEFETNALGTLIPILTPTQVAPDPYSVFAYCENTYGEVNFLGNVCTWNSDFTNKEAYGIIYDRHKEIDYPLNYTISSNSFSYTGTENCNVRGLLLHGNFTYGTQLLSNQFSKLYRDIHLKGYIRPIGATVFDPVLDPQGERLDNSTFPPTIYTIGNGNIFSDPSIELQGNIFSDATAIFYAQSISSTPPNYVPYRRSSPVSVFSPSSGLNGGALPVNCSVPSPGGLLSNYDALLNSKNICFTVFPNPTSNNVQISWEGILNHNLLKEAKIIVYNTMGQVVFTKTIDEFEQSITIESEVLIEGLYFVTLQNGGKTICTHKLLKE